MSDVEKNVSSDVTPEGEGEIGEAAVEGQEELEGLPLHLHPRGKELVAQKNAARAELDKYKELGGDPEVIAERLRRLEMWEAADEVEQEKTPARKTPATQAELADKVNRDHARSVLEDLAPEIKEIKKIQEEVKEARALVGAFKAANEEVAWETTEVIAEEVGMEPKALAGLVIPIIEGDKKLLRLYDAGRSDQAVKEAVKTLRGKLGTGSDIAERAEKITKASETTKRVPKTHAPGKTDVSVKQEDSPKDFKEAEKKLLKRLENMGM